MSLPPELAGKAVKTHSPPPGFVTPLGNNPTWRAICEVVFTG